MKVRVEHRFVGDEYAIWIFEPNENGGFIYRPSPEGFVGNVGSSWMRLELPLKEYRRDEIEPSLTIPAPIFEALIAEGSETLPPDRAQGRHLEDAMKVRDRLLAMVEYGIRSEP